MSPENEGCTVGAVMEGEGGRCRPQGTLHGSEGYPWLSRKPVPLGRATPPLTLDPKQRGFLRCPVHLLRHLEPPAIKPTLMSPTAALPGMLLLRPCVQILPGLFLFLALEPVVKCLPLTGIRFSLFALPDPLTHTSRVKL